MRASLICLFPLFGACTPPSMQPPIGGAHPTDAAPASAGSQSVELVIAATTDVHGWLRGWDYYADRADVSRGLARAATIVDSLRAAAPGRVLLVDAGDLLQGNPLAYVGARVEPDAPSPVIAAMNVMAYDAAAVGNHEFNYGVPYLTAAVAQARFPFLAANAYSVGGARAFRAWTIVERGGVRIGIIGATTPGAMIWDRENLRGRITIRDVVAEVQTALGEVRAAGTDVVMVTVHSGLTGASTYDTTTGIASENVAARLAREIPGLDLIVYGHSHQEMADTVIGTTMLMQPKNWATSVGVARLTVERVNGRWRVASKRGETIPVAGRAEQAGVVAATENTHRRTIEYVNTAIGSTPVAWRADSARVADTPVIDFILEVERRVTGADLASTAAFSLDASLDGGPITIAELARLYPYDNTLRAIRISGRQLREYLEHSASYYRTLPASGEPEGGAIVDPSIPGYNFDIVAGADYVIDLRRPVGTRITTLTFRGRTVADADSFTFALNNYRQTGGGRYSMLVGSPVVYDRQEEIRQLLIDEARRRGTIRPEDYFTRNWRIEPPEAVARAYREMLRVSSPATLPSRGSPTPPVDRSPASRTQRRLRIISTNDFHGGLEPRTDEAGVRTGGASALASAINLARAECTPGCETLLVDGGDMFQGTPISNLSYGRRVVDLYNFLGYAGAALGNHEFDWGTDTLRARMADARYGIMGANVRYTNGRDVEWIRNDTIVTRGNLRIGIIGISTQSTPTTTRAGNVAGLRFDPPAPIVDSTARALRARGAEVVVVVGHVGGTCTANSATGCGGEIFDFANALTEPIDAIVSGHSHSALDTQIRGIPIVQARSSGRAIAVIDIPIGPASPTRGMAAAEVRPLFTDSVPSVPEIDSLVSRWRSTIASLVNAPVARFSASMRKSGSQFPLGNYVADAQRWAAQTDIAVMNNGGIRTDLLSGVATYGTMFEIQPFANVIYRASIPGAALRSYLERMVSRAALNAHISGAEVQYDPSRAAGSRIVSVTMSNGMPLDDRATYTIALNDFLVTGGDGMALPPEATPARSLDIIDLDALIDYSRSRPQPVTPPTGSRFVPVSRE
jgi:2',3'-cyclic-nucleotide 2'-phosphodiesterase (5'-nucleotidase family)